MKHNLKYVFALLILFSAISCGKKDDPAPSSSATPDTGIVANITANSANLQVTLSIVGTITIDSKGICWSLSQNPTTNDTKTNEGSGIGKFTSELKGLTSNTTYFVRSYVVSSGKTTYGNQVSFKTLESLAITLTTSAATSITSTTATSGGSMVVSGLGTVATKGVCWSKSQNPTTADSKTSNGSGTNSYTSSLTNLEGSSTYFVRAYATDNNNNTVYGNQISFTTLQAFAANVQTTVISAITTTSASSGGSISIVGTGTISSRGVCWSTTSNPTITNTKVSSGSGTGTFTSSITGLTADTQYFVRAYATDNTGSTTYGNEVSFKTSELTLDGIWKPSTGSNVLKIVTASNASSWEAPYTPSAELLVVISNGQATLSTPFLKNFVKTSSTTWNSDSFHFSYTGSGSTAKITNVNYIPSKIILASSGNSFTLSGTVPSGLGYPSNLVGQSFSYTYTRKVN